MWHKNITISQLLALLILASTIALAQEPDQASKEEVPTAKQDSATKDKDLPRAKPDIDAERLRLLDEEIQPEDVNWIDAPSGKFMALWQEDMSSRTYGAILLLHGSGRSVEWPNSIRALRKNLSLHGWATLSIDLPAPEKPMIPPRPAPMSPAPEKVDENETTPDSANLEPPEPQDITERTSAAPGLKAEAISDERIDAAISFLKSKGQYNIVIVGQGLSAVRALRHIDKLASSTPEKDIGTATGKIQRPIRALVILEARNQIVSEKQNLARFINDPELPILDLHFGDHYLDSFEVQQRQRIANEKNIKHYYQVKMIVPSNSGIDHENRLTRRVRGFLNKHAKGVEVERKN